MKHAGILLFLVLASSARAAPLSDAEQLLRAGHYVEAEAALLKLKEKNPGAVLGLGRLQIETGRYAEAMKTARAAARGPQRSQALTLLGEAQRLAGQLAQSEKTLKEVVAQFPKQHRARIFLGLAYHEQGKASEAKAIFEGFYDEYDAGAISKRSAEDLTYVAMACRYTDNFRDAADTLRNALQVDSRHLEAYLEWAEISLEKYEAGYAEQYYQSALKLNPSHPRALIGLAQVKLEQSNDVESALKLLEQVEKINPSQLESSVLRAQILLDAEQNAQAEALLSQSLRRDPNHLSALTMMAASFFLRDDLAGFERQRAKVFALHPRYTKFFRDVVTLAVHHHRYAEAIELGNRAIQIAPSDWYSLAELGANYLRLGDEKNGVARLRQAWKGDPFNVRNYNLLNLFEDVLPKEYAFFSSRHFLLRVHKEEQELIRRMVVPLLERAYGIYQKKYRFTPKGPIVVELFRDPQQYAVRTVGLPGLAALGVCFGRVITSISPVNGQFNWGQVLWHELNHVFSIQLSHSRVPRWLTEGLADMEPALERPEWRRENDFDIYKALAAGKLEGVAALNSAFTRAQSMQDMVLAYYQGSLLTSFLVKTWSLDKVLAALVEYGKGKRSEQILPILTKLDLGELDRRFRAEERTRLRHYDRNWYVDLDLYGDLDARQRIAQAHPADLPTQANVALALLAAGKLKEAEAQAVKVLASEGKNRHGLYVMARITLVRGEANRAEGYLRQLLVAGGNGYEVRLALGKIALDRNDLKEATLQLGEAKRLDPERDQPYALLAKAYEKAQQKDREIDELKGLVRLEQQGLAPLAELIRLLAQRKDHAGVRRYGEMATFIQPASAEVHTFLAEAYTASAPRPDLARAVWHLETALLCRPEHPAELHLRLAKLHLQRRDMVQARAQLDKTLALDPKQTEAKKLRDTLK